MDMVGSIKRCILARHAAHFAGGLDSEVAVVSLLAPVRGELKRAQRGQALPVEQQSERGRIERVAHRAQVADAERRQRLEVGDAVLVHVEHEQRPAG